MILGLLTWGAIHERAVEHAKDTHTATVEVAKVKKEDAVIVATSTGEIQHDIVIFKQAVSIPAVPDIGVVCHVAGSVPVPAPASGNSISPAAPGQPIPGDVFDPSGDLLTISRSSQARIRELLAENQALRTQMLAANKAH